MNKIKIPKQFQLFGMTISVEFNNEKCKDHNAFGISYTGSCKIYLTNKDENGLIPKEKIEKVFFHELTHFIFNSIYEFDLDENEKLVNLFGSLLHQFLKTSKY